MYANQALLSEFLRSSEGINDVKLDGGVGESIGHWLIKIILFMETRIPEKIIEMFAWFFSIKSIFKETKHLLMNRMKALV